MYCNQIPVAYISPIGYHRHKCDECGCVWEHSDNMRGNDEAHLCPNCGVEEWLQYTGKKKPCFTIKEL